MSPHNQGSQHATRSAVGAIVSDNVEDPVEKMLDRTGCAQIHYDLQFCMADKKDWRSCQHLVKALKDCMNSKNDNSGVGGGNRSSSTTGGGGEGRC